MFARIRSAWVMRHDSIFLVYSSLDIHVISPFDAALGAEIQGVDLSTEPDGTVFCEIEAAFNRYSVLLFRDQTLTPEQHVRFSRRFGDLEIHVLDQWLHPEHPE